MSHPLDVTPSDMTPSDVTPIWIPADLDTAFKNTAVQAFGAPHLYNPKYVPLPWMIGFFGRSGMNKAEVVRMLCAKYGLAFSTTFVKATMGECGNVLNLVECTIQAVKATWEKIIASPASVSPRPKAAATPPAGGASGGGGSDDPESVAVPPGSTGGDRNGPRHLIVIDQADVLCYEADSEMTLLRAARLSEWTEANRVIIMGVFDRLPGETTAQLSPWVREAQSKFWAQFDTLLYIEAPNADYRAKLFQHYVEDFARFVNRAHPLDISALTQVEYERLADFSAFATPENILAFLRKVFSAIMMKGEEFKSLTVDFIEGFLNNRYGAPHICEFDARDVDNCFATACGRGPEVAKQQARVLKKKEAEVPTNLTGFTEDNVDLEKVMRELGENVVPAGPPAAFAGGSAAAAGGAFGEGRGGSGLGQNGTSGGEGRGGEDPSPSAFKKLKVEN